MLPELKTVLYHGTASLITAVDVARGRSHKDFGRGFYMAVSRQQAIGMMHKKYREAIRRKAAEDFLSLKERLYRIELDTEAAVGMNIRCFPQADEEWLDFVLRCRELGGVPHGFDLIIGPTADDHTLLCLKAYWDGVYGRVWDKNAKRILLQNLEPDNLGCQYYIGRQDAADRLIASITEVEWR